jgi:uncharacterized repeat protein (TIGR03803 family)
MIMKKLSLVKIASIVVMFCAVSGVAAFAQTFITLSRFGADGGYPPLGPLAQGLNGDFYGATGADAYIGGAIFAMTPGSSVTDLVSFCSRPESCGPYSVREPMGLALGADGNFYGTTYEGGPQADGAVFELSANGFTVLYGFCRQPNCADGANPSSPLVQGSADGDVYGTTGGGGANGAGTVFEIALPGKLITLYSFCSQPGCADGGGPAPLIQATDGNFYGTTSYGGASNHGTVFEMTPAGALTTLHSFCSLPSCADGSGPSPLIQASDGNLYGVTGGGGAQGDGTVFEITPAGKPTTLYSFCSQTNCTDGSGPDAGLIQASDGNFYGVTGGGGAQGAGTVFEITPAGKLTTLYSFCPGNDCRDGAVPSSLVQGTHGGFYGTTYAGGVTGSNCPGGCGTVFFLSMGLDPFIETAGRSGQVGGTVTILGDDLGRTTSVAFNGTAATFTVVSSTEITATVPTGATTGFVTVTTPIATLTSNKKFRVEP